ncbi:hypothetical protein Tco_0002123 [Tanacetum coccineum]
MALVTTTHYTLAMWHRLGGDTWYSNHWHVRLAVEKLPEVIWRTPVGGSENIQSDSYEVRGLGIPKLGQPIIAIKCGGWDGNLQKYPQLELGYISGLLDPIFGV